MFLTLDIAGFNFQTMLLWLLILLISAGVALNISTNQNDWQNMLQISSALSY